MGADMKIIEERTAPPAPTGFQSTSQILPLLGVSRRTFGTWRKRGLIPYVRLPGSRKLLFDWASVRAALLRRQNGTTAGE
jgi:predicted site-specific integrase-resolvase